MEMPKNFQVIEHPLIKHKLTFIRDKNTPKKEFKELVDEVAMLMAFEITKDLPLKDIKIETPLCKTTSQVVAGKKVGVVPILRAGLGMVDGILKLMPSARVGHIGLYRDHETLKPVSYYFKIPSVENRDFILIDPMLATGGSAVAAASMLKDAGVKNIKFMCLIAAPEGVEVFCKAHPDIHVYCAALDEKLNDKSYILPGLGDAGDRLFGTR